MTLDLSKTLVAMADAIQEATEKERERCLDIVQTAREGEIDGDFRSLISRIESGKWVGE